MVDGGGATTAEIVDSTAIDGVDKRCTTDATVDLTAANNAGTMWTPVMLSWMESPPPPASPTPTPLPPRKRFLNQLFDEHHPTDDDDDPIAKSLRWLWMI